MIIDKQESAPIIVSKKLISHEFTIAEEMKAKVMGFLRNGIYTNAPLAIIREITSNAIDANIQANKTIKEVEISLPNRLSPTFKVKDVGVGMSEEDIENIYISYGRTTKDSSNKMVGCLGIGSKSPFSFVDTFTVVARKDGIERTFCACVSKDSEEEDGCGKIIKLSETKTKESNGVEIQVPLKQNDWDTFKNNAIYYLKFFDKNNRPTVHGLTNEEIDNSLSLGYEGKNKDWFIQKYTSVYDKRENLVIMGNVAYKFEVEDDNYCGGPLKKLGVEFTDKELKILKLGVCMRAEIGDVDIAISRETVKESAKTFKFIKSRINLICAEVEETMQEKIDNLTNIWEAKNFYFELHNSDNSVLNQIQKILKTEFNFNREKITNSHFAVPKYQRVYNEKTKEKEWEDGEFMFFYLISGKHGEFTKEKRDYMFANCELPNFVIKKEGTFNYTLRLKTALNELSDFYFVNCDSEKTFKDWLKEQKLDSCVEYKDIEQFEKAAAEKRTRTPKEKGKILVYNNRCHSILADNWDKTEYDEENENYYVITKNCRPQIKNKQNELVDLAGAYSSGHFCKLSSFLNVMKKEIGVERVFGIPAAKEDYYIKRGFINLFDKFEEVAKKKIDELAQDKQDADEYNRSVNIISGCNIETVRKYYKNVNNSQLESLMDIYEKMGDKYKNYHKDREHYDSLFSLYEQYYGEIKKKKPSHNLSLSYGNFINNYPLLSQIGHIFNHTNKDFCESVGQYIELIDNHRDANCKKSVTTPLTKVRGFYEDFLHLQETVIPVSKY